MAVTPDQARARLQDARTTMAMARTLHHGREKFDVDAQVSLALEKVISLLEDALVQ